jgi:tetratricopeptide (TPR) repeat protein
VSSSNPDRSRAPRASCALLLLAFALTTPAGLDARPRPRADPEKARRDEARKLLKAGGRLLADGYYVGALAKFEEAYQVFPSPRIFFNYGQVYTELGRYLDAIVAFERFLAEAVGDAPPKELRELEAAARKAITDLEARIAVLTLTVNEPGAQVSVDGARIGVTPLPRPIRLMPGSHSIVVAKEGFVTGVLELKLEAKDRVERAVSLAKPRPKVVQVQVKVIYKTVRKPRRGLPVLWSGVALTAAAGLTAAILGGLALREDKIVHASGSTLAEKRAAADRGKRYQQATDGLLLATGVLAAATLTWGLVVVRRSGGTERIRITEPGEPRLTVLPVLGPQGAGVQLGLRF